MCAYEINRTLGWIGEALDRARGKGSDSTNPRVVPDVIMPKVDVFGWDSFQRMKTASSQAVAGIEQVFPALSADWQAELGGNAAVPPGVALRVITSMHIQHIGFVANLIMWFGVLDREGGSTGIATETGTGTAIPQSTPLCIVRPVYLRPTETIIGRVRNLNAGATLNIFYTWIDFREGEYIQSAYP